MTTDGFGNGDHVSLGEGHALKVAFGGLVEDPRLNHGGTWEDEPRYAS